MIPWLRATHVLRLVGVLALAAISPPLAADASERRKLELEDIDRIVSVSSPQVSPDGNSIVVVVSRTNVEKNRYDSNLVLLNIATKAQRTLTFERVGVGHPRWSPSGDRLAFLARASAEKEAKPQIFVMPMSGGDAVRLTDAPLGVQHFTWSPDGKQIAFAAADEPEKRANKADDAFEVGNDGVLATSAPNPVHAWVISADGGKARRLTSGKWSLPVTQPPGSPSSPLSWSPDGKSLALVHQPGPSYGLSDQTHVQILELGDNPKPRSLTSKKAFESHPEFSPDGAQVMVRYPRDGNPNQVTDIHLVPTKGGEGVNVTQGIDRQISFAAWTADGKQILVGANDHTTRGLWLQPVDGGTARKLKLGPVIPGGAFSVDADLTSRGSLALVGSEPNRPAELYFLASLESTPVRLTDFNAAIAELDLGKVESLSWPSDGFQADGVLTYPPGFDPAKKYPLVVYIHGGPTTASTEAFSQFPRILASRGRLVFEPNYRGSDNLGNAFQRAIFNDAGAGPGRDVMAGLELLKTRSYVDSSRLAVAGWSYGGFMSVWLGAHHDCWKTVIAGAAAIDRIDQYNLADYNVLAGRRFKGSPWVGEFDKDYREQSPLYHARKIKAPTLITALTGDARVPITQSFRLYHALRDNNVPVRFIAYPVPGHAPSDPFRRKDVYRRWNEWLDEHLQ